MNVSVEQVLETTRDQMLDELNVQLMNLHGSDLLISELIALVAILRPVYARALEAQADPAPVVKLHSVTSRH
jgi:hypothetical protein